MKELTINIEDYLDHEEIKELVKESLKNHIYYRFNTEPEIQRLLDNSCYHIMVEELGKLVPNFKDIMMAKLKELFEKKDWSFEVFYKGDYSRKESEAMKVINQAVVDNKQRIQERVLDAINDYDVDKIVSQRLYEAFSELSNGSGDIANFFWNKLCQKDNHSTTQDQ